MAWKVCPGAALTWRNWDDDEYLLFDGASGDTHLVNRVTAEVLGVLGRSALDEDMLCLEVARSMEVDPAALAPNFGPLLAHLQRLGLVESIP